MGGAYAVGTGVPATDDEHVLVPAANQVLTRNLAAIEDTVLLGEQLQSEINALQFPARDVQVAGLRGAGANHHRVEILQQSRSFGALRESGSIDASVETEFYALLLQQGEATVDYGLVELEIGDTVAQQTSSPLVFVKDGDAVTLEIQAVGSHETGRAAAYHSHLAAVAYRTGHAYVVLAESHLGDGGLVLAVGSRLVGSEIQHAGFLAEGRADASGELREVIGGV